MMKGCWVMFVFTAAMVACQGSVIESVPAYGVVTVDVPGLNPTHYEDPYNPDQISVLATFTTGGRTGTVKGFLFQDYVRSLSPVSGTEVLEATGPLKWLVKYTPVDLGLYSYTIQARDVNGTRTLDTGSFECIDAPGPLRGFLSVAPTVPGDHDSSPGYFHVQTKDEDSPYYAVGYNVCWYGANKTYDYDLWFAHLAAAGATYSRLWIGCDWGFIAESVRSGLGRYEQSRLWQLDYVISLATKLNIRLLLCLDSFNSLRITDPFPAWNDNPYNKAKGGVIDTPDEFFTSPVARKYYKRRLQYLVSRYAHSTAVIAWEFWNEVDLVENFAEHVDDVMQWHHEMSTFIREEDNIYQHMRTTSFSNPEGILAIESLPSLDYAQTHTYTRRDMADEVAHWDVSKTAWLGKPHIVAECGFDQNITFIVEKDPTGVSVHNSIWGAVASGGAGTGMQWWWDTCIDPLQLYHHYLPNDHPDHT